MPDGLSLPDWPGPGWASGVNLALAIAALTFLIRSERG
jgi:hypothetical protein